VLSVPKRTPRILLNTDEYPECVESTPRVFGPVTARVTNEIPTSRTVVALRRGHLALLVGLLSSVAHHSLPTQLLESNPAAYKDNPAALPL
jgi:hypothetical protein